MFRGGDKVAIQHECSQFHREQHQTGSIHHKAGQLPQTEADHGQCQEKDHGDVGPDQQTDTGEQGHVEEHGKFFIKQGHDQPDRHQNLQQKKFPWTEKQVAIFVNLNSSKSISTIVRYRWRRNDVDMGLP